jgi:hypothetical protein
MISHLNKLNTNIPYFLGSPGTILGQAYKYGGVKFINGIPTLLSSVLNLRGLKIEILPVILFVLKSPALWVEGGVKYSRALICTPCGVGGSRVAIFSVLFYV